MYQWAEYAAGLPTGDGAEVGVWRGGSARLIAEALADRPVHLFDTFAGIPHADPSIDRRCVGVYGDTSIERVRRTLEGRSNTHLYPGVFPATAAAGEREGGLTNPFAFVHLDADVYPTTRDGLEWFWPRMVPGGVVVVDDYGDRLWPGVARAVDAFALRTGCPVMTRETLQCWLLRP